MHADNKPGFAEQSRTFPKREAATEHAQSACVAAPEKGDNCGEINDIAARVVMSRASQ